MSATSAALSVIEILEQILSRLPPLDIIRCKQVDRTWCALITHSPLLQYKSWLRNDCPDPTRRTKATYPLSDFFKPDKDGTRYTYLISKHLHPIFAAAALENSLSEYRRTYSFELFKPDGSLDYFTLRPVVMRPLLKWYAANKHTENAWGHMALFRPHAESLNWETSMTDGAGVPFHLNVESCRRPNFFSPADEKPEEQPPFLTLSDLFRVLGRHWRNWVDAENETHYLSHDGEGCDVDEGMPGDLCLKRYYRIGGYEDSDEDTEDDEDDEEEKSEHEDYVEDEEVKTLKEKMSDSELLDHFREEYLCRCMEDASA